MTTPKRERKAGVVGFEDPDLEQGPCPPHIWRMEPGQENITPGGAKVPVIWKCAKCKKKTLRRNKPKPNDND